MIEMLFEYIFQQKQRCLVVNMTTNEEHSKGRDDRNGEKLDLDNSVSRERVTWSSTFEFVASLIGYSAGMSDFWRFPYLVWRNGGGAFLVAYGLTMIACGIPLYILEVLIGQYSGKEVFDVWNFSPLFKGIGISIAVLNFGFVTYLSTMRYWWLEYLRQSFVYELPWSTCGNPWNTPSCRLSQALLSSSSNEKIWNLKENTTTYPNTTAVSAEEEFWQYNILSLSSGIDDIGYVRWWLVLWAIVIKIITVVCLLKSVQSLGKLMIVTAFLPPCIGLAMFIQALTQNGAADGLLFLFTPDFSKLAEAKVWIEAVFMAFYSLGPAWGGVIMMGSHLKFHTKCLRTVFTSVVADVFISVFSSACLFAVVGVMASENGVPVEEVVKSGMSIGLVGYSRALAFLPAPYIWAVVFFLAIVIVGLDSQVVCTETVVSYLNGFSARLGRHGHLLLVVLVTIVSLLLNLPFCTQAGPYMFQLIDWYLPTWAVIVIALLEVIAIMWFYGGDRVDSDLKDMTGRKIPHVFRVAAAYVSPLLFLLLLITSFVTYRPPTYGDYVYPGYTDVIGWLISISIVIPIPFYIVLQFIKLPGTFKQKWGRLTQPSSDWGPSDSDYRLQYLERIQTERSLTDLAYYNLTGTQRYPTKKHCEIVAL